MPDCRPEDHTLATVLDRFAAIGDPWQEIDGSSGSLEPLLDLAERLGPAEKPPKGPAGASPTMPLIEIARAKTKPEALEGLERWKARHTGVAGHLEAADVLVDGMRGRELGLVPHPSEPPARPGRRTPAAGASGGGLRPVGGRSVGPLTCG